MRGNDNVYKHIPEDRRNSKYPIAPAIKETLHYTIINLKGRNYQRGIGLETTEEYRRTTRSTYSKNRRPYLKSTIFILSKNYGREKAKHFTIDSR